MIRSTDRLDYEDLAARIKGEPADTARNKSLLLIRSMPHAKECELEFHRTYQWSILSLRAAGAEEAQGSGAATMFADMRVSELRVRLRNSLHDDHLDALRAAMPWSVA